MRSLMNDDGLPLPAAGCCGLGQQLETAMVIGVAENFIVLLLALTFTNAEHQPNNYGNFSAPMSLDESAQFSAYV